MLKVRIIPILLYKDFGLVKGVGFDSWRRTGSAEQAINVYALREVDEIVFIDILATPQGRGPDFTLIDNLADNCFMPMTVGGGVRSVEDVRGLLAVGADKVLINTAALENIEIISQSADIFGSQCIVVGIDYRTNLAGKAEVYSHCGKINTGLELVEYVKEVEKRGAGEIILTSIDRDGLMQGYDLEILKTVSLAVNIPVIASGGAGTYQHMYEALTLAKVSAVAAASMFHFTEQTPREAKKFLSLKNIPVRAH